MKSLKYRSNMRLHFDEYNFGVMLYFLGLLSLAGGMFLYKVDGDDCVGRIIATIVITTGLFSWYLAFHFIESYFRRENERIRRAANLDGLKNRLHTMLKTAQDQCLADPDEANVTRCAAIEDVLNIVSDFEN